MFFVPGNKHFLSMKTLLHLFSSCYYISFPGEMTHGISMSGAILVDPFENIFSAMCIKKTKEGVFLAPIKWSVLE